MTQVIHKFPLTMATGSQTVEALRGIGAASIVHVGWDERNACPALWVRLDPSVPRLPAALAPVVRVVATGEEFDHRAKHLGTVQHGGFVWHVLLA